MLFTLQIVINYTVYTIYNVILNEMKEKKGDDSHYRSSYILTASF